MERIDVLPARYPGIDELHGDLVSGDTDPTLLALSEQASRDLAMPMAAVTLLTERVQLLRGHHGLPTELAAASATDRDVSFCQFVVRDQGLLEINDAENDERLPQWFVQNYGVAAYLGAPVSINNRVVGAMCVLDTKPRTFDDRDRAILMRAAAAASERLQVLAEPRSKRAKLLHDRAVRPAFQELRNCMQPLVGNLDALEATLGELEASHRLAKYIAQTGDTRHAGILTHTDDAFASAREMLAEMQAETERVIKSVVAIERVSLTRATPCRFDDIVETAIELSHHQTKLVGGVVTHGNAHLEITTENVTAVRAVAAAFSGYAELAQAYHTSAGIDAELATDDTHARITISAPEIGAAPVDALASHLRALIDDAPGVIVQARANTLALAFTR